MVPGLAAALGVSSMVFRGASVLGCSRFLFFPLPLLSLGTNSLCKRSPFGQRLLSLLFIRSGRVSTRTFSSSEVFGTYPTQPIARLLVAGSCPCSGSNCGGTDVGLPTIVILAMLSLLPQPPNGCRVPTLAPFFPSVLVLRLYWWIVRRGGTHGGVFCLALVAER